MKQTPEELRETRRRWRANNPEKEAGYRKKRYAKYREHYKQIGREGYYKRKVEVLNHYGRGRCAHCGINDIRVLSIDHISGGGLRHRRSLGINSGSNFYAWLKNNGYPEGFQVLCMNCQFIKRAENKEI